MQSLSCSEVIEATKGVLVSGNINTKLTGISTDSRRINSGDLFIPLVGERFDGHDFIESALDSGAVALLTHRDTKPLDGRVIIRVEDTLKALQDLARYYRKKFCIPFIAVTGSVGKTSTKDMIACVLSQRFKVLKTCGNLNNEIGLPLTVLNLDITHEIAVVELGMSGFGEISRLASIALPDIAVITNIGLSHVEKLGSRQNILKAKMEILDGLKERGTVVLNGDDNLLFGLKGLLSFRTVYYGIGEGLDYQAYNILNAGEKGTFFEISLYNREYRVHIPVPGIHNIYNALSAIAVGILAGVPVNEIIKGIEEFSPGKMRLNIISAKKIKIIDDAYNASPQSMEAAISVLNDIKGVGRTIAVLGDMLELGACAQEAHLGVGRFAAAKGIDYIVTVGENGGYIAKGAVEAGISNDRVFSFASNEQAVGFLDGFVKEGDVVLVKGSRGMKMEQVVDYLKGE